MNVANKNVREARHGGVYGVARHLVAQNLVRGVGRHRADNVARVNVLERDGFLDGRKMFADTLAQVRANVFRADIPRGIFVGLAGAEKMLPRSFSLYGKPVCKCIFVLTNAPFL
jgi:hypothetical protein